MIDNKKLADQLMIALVSIGAGEPQDIEYAETIIEQVICMLGYERYIAGKEVEQI